MMRRMRRAVLAAWWALRHADDLTMLRHDLEQAAKERNSRGGILHSAYQADWWLKRYLGKLPIR